MSGDSSAALWETVARRADLLDELREGPREKRALVSALSVSRSTVDRAVAELSELGLVTDANGEVGSTATGDLVAVLYRDAASSADELLRLAPYLDALDEPLRPPPAFFGETTIVTVEDDTHAPGERLIDAFLTADRCRLVRGTIRPAFAAEVRERMFDGSLELEVAFCPDSVEVLRSYHGVDLERVLDLPHVTVRAYPEPLHSGLYLFETDGERSVRLSIHDRTTDRVRVLLGTDRPAAVAWAERTLREVYERSSPVATDQP
jgi:predicted transcriptional regulator